MNLPPTAFSAVCFDCDSTLSHIEGVDELALRAGVFDEIAPLTTAAMEGCVALNEIYGARLELVRPDRAAIDWLGGRYIETVVAGAADAVARLQGLDKSVHIISGGIRQAILPLARTLGIAEPNVHAVNIEFDAEGNYAGFDAYSPLITPDGKSLVCQDVVARHGATAMVGDGLTDVAARAGGAYVVGFGGVVARDVVRERADMFVEEPDLTATLGVLLHGEAGAHG